MNNAQQTMNNFFETKIEGLSVVAEIANTPDGDTCIDAVLVLGNDIADCLNEKTKNKIFDDYDRHCARLRGEAQIDRAETI